MTDDLLVQKFEALTRAVEQQAQMVNLIVARLKEVETKINGNAAILDKLGAAQGIEYVEELGAWVSQRKWEALRRQPRDEPASETPGT